MPARCWPWTAATPRPTWRSSAWTARCARWSAGPARLRTRSAWTAASPCSPSCPAAPGFAASTTVRNDTYAILRTGTDRGWGVAVACGAGINCVGVAPDGREHRFGSLGPLSGDWGGGGDLGLGAVGAAVRAEDGRGPGTVLAESVPAYFGLASPAAVAEAFHLGAVKESRLVELAPLVLAASAAGDAEAGRRGGRLADEVVAFVRAAVSRLGLAGSGLDVRSEERRVGKECRSRW